MLAVSKTIQIDGAVGEGGGQMLRTSLSLSLITGQPFEMVNIRAGRNKPGLLRQHLTAVLAAAQIGRAEVAGAVLGSQSLLFTPTTIKAGEYRFVIGSAGSGTLVFQTILPALMLASCASVVTIQGGTHNNAAPTSDYLDRAFLPFIRRMGPKVRLTLDRYGFYPAGGGQFRAEITPSRKLDPLYLSTRAAFRRKQVTAVIANLPRSVAQREVNAVEQAGLGYLEGPVESQIIETRNSPGPGNVLMLEVESDGVTEMFTSFGQPGVSAEIVAKEVISEASGYLQTRALAGEHLADQLLLPMALSGKGCFTATKLTQHAVTNMDIIRLFLPVQFQTEDKGDHVKVLVGGA